MSDNLLRRSDRIHTKKSKQPIETNVSQTNHKISAKSQQIKCEKKKKQLICEKCLSHDVKEVVPKSSKRNPNLRLTTCIDSISEKWIKVCDNCAKLMTPKNKINDNSSKISIEEQKRKYLSNCHSFGLSLVQILSDCLAQRLYCPNMRTTGKACACLQRYVIGTDNDLKEKQRRAQHLLDLLSKAKHLSQQKCYSMSNPKNGQKIGLGNGHKKSKEFENFVNNQRNHLRNDFKFCEKAVQRVLFYSNNFLHKKLRTEPNGRQRVESQKGKSVLAKLIQINSLVDHYCCVNRCLQLCQTRPQLLEEWRQRAIAGQMEARRVIGEMLTPTQAVRSNCFKFVSLVTGSSIRTISKVNQFLITNGGSREPAEHGLKRICILSDKRQTTKSTNSSDHQIMQNMTQNDTSLPNNLSPDSVQNNRIALIVNQTNNEISVINSGKKQTIAILSPPIDLITTSTNSRHIFEIPLTITSNI